MVCSMSVSDYDRTWCNNIITELLKWPLTQPFRIAVDPVRDGAADYLKIVTHPMDLGKVKRKLLDKKYKSVESFIDDLRLICSNAILFNGANSMYAYIATDINTWIDEQLAKKASSQEDEWQKRLAAVVEKLHKHMANAPPPE